MADQRVPEVGLRDRLFAALQYVLPKHLLTRVVYGLARSENLRIRNALLRAFLRGYTVNMEEAIESNPYAYRSFNAFFTRALKPGARPIDPDPRCVVSPVDGALSQCGELESDRLLQAKGHYYSLEELLAGDMEAVEAYRGGRFACIYLAPFNYHRIHMPCAATLHRNVYAPGELFSVNASTARAVPRVFARNERLICDFESEHGRMAVILVGALFVGSIETVHCGEVNAPPRVRSGMRRIDEGVGRRFAKGDELGRFNMGSTVVLLFQKGRIDWDPALIPGAAVQLGRVIGRAR